MGKATIYRRWRTKQDLVVDTVSDRIGVDAEVAARAGVSKGTIYVWAPVPEGHTSASYCEMVLEESAVVVSPGGAYGANGVPFFVVAPMSTVDLETAAGDAIPIEERAADEVLLAGGRALGAAA